MFEKRRQNDHPNNTIVVGSVNSIAVLRHVKPITNMTITTNYEQIPGWTTEKLEFDTRWRETIIV
jgi:hypothetical protein